MTPAQKKILQTHTAWKATLETIRDVILRKGVATAYEDIVNAMSKIESFLRTQE